ncbi:hypothetical protein [Chryseobacterium wanjuense]
MKKLLYPWVMIMFITTSACSQSSSSDNDEMALQAVPNNSFQEYYTKTYVRIWRRW